MIRRRRGDPPLMSGSAIGGPINKRIEYAAQTLMRPL
jgi:hypothetical protein